MHLAITIIITMGIHPNDLNAARGLMMIFRDVPRDTRIRLAYTCPSIEPISGFYAELGMRWRSRRWQEQQQPPQEKEEEQ